MKKTIAVNYLSLEKIRNTIGLFLIFSLLIYIDRVIIVNPDGYFSVSITAGFLVGIYSSKGRKILFPFLLAGLTSVFLFSLLIDNQTLLISIITAIGYGVFMTLLAFIYDFILNSTEHNKNFTTFDVILYILRIMFTVVIVSILPSIIERLTIQDLSFFVVLLRNALSLFIGVLIFGGLYHASFLFDKSTTKSVKRVTVNVIAAILFITYSVFVFSEVIYGDYFFGAMFLYIIIFFIIGACYSFRILALGSVLYLVLAHLLLLNSSSIINFKTYLYGLYFYLTILIAMAVVINFILYRLRDRNMTLKKTNTKLKNMMNSSITLLKIADSTAINGESYSKEYLKKVFNIAIELFDSYDYALCVFKTGDSLEIIDTVGYNIDLFKDIHITSEVASFTSIKATLYRDATKAFKLMFGSKYDKYKDSLPKITESVRIIVQIGATNVGGITFDKVGSKYNKYSSEDIDNYESFRKLINTFQENNSLAIKNANLKDNIVLSLVGALELHDEYTGGHSEDVAEISLDISRSLMLSKEDRYDTYWSGILHDIGKLGITDTILNKPAKLSADEYLVIKKHPIHGFDLLSKSEELKDIARYVRHHHEWWDGSGYPDGLKGDEIPLISQILQVADSVSTMSTRRPYSVIKSNSEIIDELILFKGKQFSPVIADVMIDIIKKTKLKRIYSKRHNSKA